MNLEKEMSLEKILDTVPEVKEKYLGELTEQEANIYLLHFRKDENT